MKERKRWEREMGEKGREKHREIKREVGIAEPENAREIKRERERDT